MRFRISYVCTVSVLSICALTSSVSATTTYSYFYVAGQTSYDNVTPGSAVDVSLYLQEVNSDGSSNSLLSNEDGLFGAGVGVSQFSSSNGNPTTITGVNANSGSPTAGFDNVLDASYSSPANTAAILEQLNFSDVDGVAAVTQGSGVSTVYLGMLILQASSSAGQTTEFTVGVYDPNNGNTVTFDNGYDLDNVNDPLNPADASDLYSSAASTNFSITTSESAIPEPTSLALIAMSAFLLNARRRRAD
jgi:hypothetical protein